jgi:hypothetical protein
MEGDEDLRRFTNHQETRILAVRTEAAKRGQQLKERRRRTVLRNAIHFWGDIVEAEHMLQANNDGSSIASSQIEDNHQLASHTSALWKAGELRDRCVRGKQRRLMSETMMEWASNRGNNMEVREEQNGQVEGDGSSIGSSQIEVNHELAAHTSAAFKAADLRERSLRSQAVSRNRRAIVAWEDGIEVQHEEKRSLDLELQRQEHADALTALDVAAQTREKEREVAARAVEAAAAAELADAHNKMRALEGELSAMAAQVGKLHADLEKKGAATSGERSALDVQVEELHAELEASARALTSQTAALTEAREQARSFSARETRLPCPVCFGAVF